MGPHMLTRLREGLESMHDDGKRRDFLLEIGARLDEVSTWLGEARLADMVDAQRPPTFLHGGHSRDRWIVMGINPGADIHQDEHDFKRRSPDDYFTFHERFFEHFPALRPNGKQPWWAKLCRVMRGLETGVDPGPISVDWPKLLTESTFVAQDLLPFHGRRSATLPREFAQGSVLRQLATATIAGVRRSKARGLLVFSRHGYELFHSHAGRKFKLQGMSRKGHHREIKGYVDRIGDVPVVALDNEFIAQPKFSYYQALPQLFNELRIDHLV